MRFAEYILDNRRIAGIAAKNGYYGFVDLLGNNAPKTVLDFIREYENKQLPDFTALISQSSLKAAPADRVRLCAPIQPFRNVLCLGKNYADHAKETVASGLDAPNESCIPQKPVYFAKNAYPAAGDGEAVPLQSHFTQKVDYEVELAVVIGKKTWRISEEQAEDAVFGYTILNDVTARDAQTDYGQWYFGKSVDGFCPIGPTIITKDELPFPIELDVCCRVNGEVRQKSNTSMLIFDIPRIISELSQGIALYPGDIIATGTPGGIGHAMNPPRYLKKGDKVECEIEKLGVLTNFFE